MHVGRRKRDGKVFAIKSVDKRKIVSNRMTLYSLQREIEIMRLMDHPWITKLHEVYENEIYIHMVTEYLEGGELFDILQHHSKYSEKEVSRAIQCVLEALAYCHEHHVIHRDIKPENLLLMYFIDRIARGSDPKKDLSLKVADFGLATITNPEVPEKQRCGSPGYVAPEVLNNQGYGTKADIFSVGVILYILYSCGIVIAVA